MAKNSYYYNIEDDIEKYPDAWCYIVVGGRNTGKTYGVLKSCKVHSRTFTFVKRTQEDVQLLCAGGTGQGGKDYDLSPFKAINRDMGCNVRALSVNKGIGGFWECDEDGAHGAPIGYITALSVVNKVKGFDLSDSDWMIFDEFIPQPWERVSRKEGEQILDMYKTISRDREHRGRKPLKLIALANATKLSNPLMNILEVTDVVTRMKEYREPLHYIADRGILIHLLDDNDEFRKKESESAIYKAMIGTKWGSMSLDNDFAYDDTSNVVKMSIKGMRPLYSIIYKGKTYILYAGNGQKYFTDSPTNKDIDVYNLDLENDQKRFYIERVIDLRSDCIDGYVKFKYYTLYDLVINYKSFYKV